MQLSVHLIHNWDLLKSWCIATLLTRTCNNVASVGAGYHKHAGICLKLCYMLMGTCSNVALVMPGYIVTPNVFKQYTCMVLAFMTESGKTRNGGNKNGIANRNGCWLLIQQFSLHIS